MKRVKKPPILKRILDDFRATLSELRDPTLALWALYILLFPVYVWENGLPQPGDILVILLAPVVLIQKRARLPLVSRRVMRALYIFMAWVIAVNIGWTIILNVWTLSGKRSFLWAPLFYIYNVVVFLVYLVLHQRYGSRLLHVTSKLVLYTLLLQVLFASVVVHGRHRETVLFNSPNQLGYYALLSASMLLILQRRNYATTLEVVIGTTAATYLALVSASKAALGGILILGLVVAISRLKTMLVVAVVVLPLLVIPNPMLNALERAQTRIENDDSFGFMEERGYDRVLNHPEYWVLGSGEGNYKRFTDGAKIGSHEIHSSIGTLFFCYGIVGVAMFAAFILRVLKGSRFETYLFVLPSLAYGMTHQGLRFTLFWVLLAIIVVLRIEQSAEKTAAQRRASATS